MSDYCLWMGLAVVLLLCHAHWNDLRDSSGDKHRFIFSPRSSPQKTAALTRATVSQVIFVLLNWAVMNSDQSLGAPEVINFAIVVLCGTKMAAAWKPRCPSRSLPDPVKVPSVRTSRGRFAGWHDAACFQKFVSSPAKAESWMSRWCVSPTVVLTAETPGRTWRMTWAACNSAEGQQSEATISERLFRRGVIGHVDFTLEVSEINLFTGFDPASRSQGINNV